MLESKVGRGFLGALALITVATAVGLVLLWPDKSPGFGLAAGLGAGTEGARVVGITSFPCSGSETQTCRRVRIGLLSGPERGQRSAFELGTGGIDPPLSVGDEVRVSRAPPVPGLGGTIYSLADFERRAPMLWLAVAFGLLVVVFGRLRGAFSLVGLALSLAVVLAFVIPGILAGRPPLAVAVVGSFAVMLVTISLAHGLGPKGTAAMLGTAVSLGLTVGLAVAFTTLTNLTGLASEEAAVLAANESGVPLRGLLLAGMIIGALGVLDDVTVSQASAVLAIRSANPVQGLGTLFRRALGVGRDHVSATVNTLVLAYAGASLPSLLIFASTELDLGETVNSELVAQEVVATLVGSIGLIAAVPITTALAAVLSARIPPERLSDSEHGHAH
ncbi:MAG: YibE/F family protein [Thermoleophilaceae bacterium]|nr:YibE/F family protein [Thermoleophilaceae bacterium]